jgi:ribosomal subunit interface protein
MQLTIQGQHLDVGDSLRSHVTDKLESINEKYFGRAIDAKIIFSKETNHLFKTHISLRMGKDISVEATAKEHDVYQCFDSANDKIAKQLRRYKRRLRDHHERMVDTPETEMMKANAYVLSEMDSEPEDEAATYENAEPTVVAEMVTNIQTMTVSEAVMRMDLAHQGAIMFRNAKHGGLNMVYRRADGNIGWVDPQEVSKGAEASAAE